MQKFDMSAAWDDAMTLVRAHLPLTSVLAGIFFFLPGMVTALLGPVPLVPPVGATPEQLSDLLIQDMQRQAPWLLGAILASTVGQIAILRLWLARSGTSVGDALVFALAMLPTAIALFLIQVPLFTVAVLLLIVPAIYLIGRLAVIYPWLTDNNNKNPIAALAASWRLTDGNGWRVSLFILLILIAIIIISLIVTSITGLFGTQGSAAYIVGSIINSTLSAALGLINTAVLAAVYRQFATRNAHEVFS